MRAPAAVLLAAPLRPRARNHLARRRVRERRNESAPRPTPSRGDLASQYALGYVHHFGRLTTQPSMLRARFWLRKAAHRRAPVRPPSTSSPPSKTPSPPSRGSTPQAARPTRPQPPCSPAPGARAPCATNTYENATPRATACHAHRPGRHTKTPCAGPRRAIRTMEMLETRDRIDLAREVADEIPAEHRRRKTPHRRRAPVAPRGATGDHRARRRPPGAATPPPRWRSATGTSTARGAPRHPRRAEIWYFLAAGQGHPLAALALARMHASGEHLRESQDLAHQWLTARRRQQVRGRRRPLRERPRAPGPLRPRAEHRAAIEKAAAQARRIDACGWRSFPIVTESSTEGSRSVRADDCPAR